MLIKKYKYSILLTSLFVLFASTMSFAQKGLSVDQEWSKLLQNHVSSDGVVDYKGFKKDPAFPICIANFKGTNPDDSWTKNEWMAFWMNAYNAFTVQLIVDNYPLKSITNLDEPWDQKFINIGGNSYSLNQIEHELLRAKYKDPKIHFGVNCASYSCPKIHNVAFTPTNVQETLEKLTREFVNDNKKNSLSAKSVSVSKIFDWYAGDFTTNGSLIYFLNQYAEIEINDDAKISFKDYNWDLNNK